MTLVGTQGQAGCVVSEKFSTVSRLLGPWVQLQGELLAKKTRLKWWNACHKSASAAVSLKFNYIK